MENIEYTRKGNEEKAYVDAMNKLQFKIDGENRKSNIKYREEFFYYCFCLNSV